MMSVARSAISRAAWVKPARSTSIIRGLPSPFWPAPVFNYPHHRLFHRSFCMSDKHSPESDSASWKWVPPRARRVAAEERGDLEDIVPIRMKEYLTVEEVSSILQHYKGENILSIPIGDEKLFDGVEHFVLVTGDTSRHLRRMADAILKQVRNRKLVKAAAFKNGVEGDKVDEWLVVDCHNLVVHCLLPATRKHLDLESHWGAPSRPYAKYTGSDKAYDDSLDKLFNKYPPPEGEESWDSGQAHHRSKPSSGKDVNPQNVVRLPSSSAMN